MSSLTVVQPRATQLTVVPASGPASLLAVPRRVSTVVMSQQRGPRGVKGDPGTPVRFDVPSPAATWTIPHPFDHRPMVDVFDPSGSRMLTDVQVDLVHIVVTFPSPTAGFVLAV